MPVGRGPVEQHLVQVRAALEAAEQQVAPDQGHRQRWDGGTCRAEADQCGTHRRVRRPAGLVNVRVLHGPP